MPTPLPRGYGEQQPEPGVRIIARRDLLPRLALFVHQAGTVYDYALHHAPARLEGGRGPVPLLESKGGERWAVRHCWRGGAVARVLRDRFLRIGRSRPRTELAAQVALSSQGVATPRVLAAVTYGHGAWYRGDVVTAFIPDAADLAALTLGPARWSEAERERAWFAAGTLLRGFFATGARHADLNLRNILVQREPMTAYLLDLDRCRVGGRPAASAQRAMLARFDRSRAKLEARFGRAVASGELAAFARGVGK